MTGLRCFAVGLMVCVRCSLGFSSAANVEVGEPKGRENRDRERGCDDDHEDHREPGGLFDSEHVDRDPGVELHASNGCCTSLT